MKIRTAGILPLNIKQMKMKNILICCLALVLISYGCNNNREQKSKPDVVAKTDTVPAVPVIINKDSLLVSTGQEILKLLKNKHYDSLVKFFAPEEPVHFSPYGFIGSGTQTLTAKDFMAGLSSGKKINWGTYDGSGEPIELSLKQYLEKFVYNADFLNAEKTGIDQMIGSGNSLNNLKKMYPDGRFIEYHFSGFDKKFAGMDWTSLRLVFKEKNNSFYLQAIVHDQWTI
jgi:hypothetical protein